MSAHLQVRARRWSAPWRSRAGLLALGVLAVQLLWRGWYVVHGFFTQDDFVIIALARKQSVGSLLLSDYYGHLLPARWLLADVVAHGGQLPWGVAATLILVLMVITSALMWVVLDRLLPGRWIRLPLLALFCFSPLTLWTAQQWIVAMQFYPVTICLLVSVWALLRRLEDDWRPGAWLPPVLTAVALLFQERALLFLVAYAGLALLSVEGSFASRVPTALRRLWPTWAGLVAVVAAYVGLHAATAPIQATPLAHQSGDLLALIGNLVFRNAIPGLLGGPWHPVFFGDAALVPPSWAVLVAVAVLLVLVVLTSVRGGARAWWAWATVGLYLAADVGILFGGKSQFGVDIGLIPRYTADLAPVFVIGVAAALRDVRPLRLPGRLATLPRPGLAVAGAVVVALVALPTTLVVAPVLENHDDRTYAENLATQVRRTPDAVLFDARPPDTILVPWFGDRTRVSTILSTVHPTARYDLPTADLQVPDGLGLLHHAAIGSAVHARKGRTPRCGYPVRATPVTIPMAGTVPAGRRVARIDYYTGTDTVLSLSFGTAKAQTVQFAADAGLHSTYVVVEGPFDHLTAQDDDRKVTVCVAEVAVGDPVPAPVAVPSP